MANTPDSPELIGGSFALGQWLAEHDPSFKNLWSTWCSEIQSVQGVPGESSVVLEAVLEVVRQDNLEKEDRKLVFKYTGPGIVNPLKVPVEGDNFLEQTHAILTAAKQPVDQSTALIDEAEEDAEEWPTIESIVDSLPSIPGEVTEVSLPQIPSAAAFDFVTLVSAAESHLVIPRPITSITTLTLPGPSAADSVTLPKAAEPAIATAVVFEPSNVAPTLTLPGASEAEILTPPPSVEPAKARAVIPEPPDVSPPLTLPGAAEAEIVTPPQAAEPLIAKAVLPEPLTDPALRLPATAPAEIPTLPAATDPAVAGPLIPKPAESLPPPLPLPGTGEAEVTTLPELGKPSDAAPIISTLSLPDASQPLIVTLPEIVPAVPTETAMPQPSTPPSTLPQPERAGEFATVGQYFLPLGPVPEGEGDGSTLADAVEDLPGAKLPQAASEVLGHLQINKEFLVLSRQFKGLVLEVGLDQPIASLVRLALAKENDLWTFGGEFIVPRESKNRTPLIFILKFAAGKDSKSLVMALNGDVNLVDDLLRPMFGDRLSIPQGLGLKVMNPALVIVKEKSGTNGESVTKALIAVSLEAEVDFSKLPFVGEVIKAQGPVKMTLGIQYASGPFAAEAITEINSVLSSDLHLATDDGAAFDGLHLSVALQMAGKPLLLSVPLSGDNEQEQATPAVRARDQGPGAPTKPTDADLIKWIKVNRTLGPAYLDKIGVGFKDGAVQFRVSASVQLSVLNFFVEGLGGGMKLAWPPETPTFNLDGLGIGLEVPPISISGALIRTTVNGVDSYDGMALIKAASFTITGLGSYSTVNGDPSLFIFAILHQDLGGPSFFHVTGLAAGFGFNRALKLPPIEEVQNFPLVRGALEDDYFVGSGSKAITGAMEKLRDYIPPSGGDYWFAAGIRFNSFEMIQSFALLSISFGHEVVIGLLGLSRMSLPKGAKPGSAIAYAELALRAVIKPNEGSIEVEGRLTDNSYIFSKDCRLTGGFAFYTWFSGPHSGDFVITLGGYHPKFIRPEHYPIVPRLGINWRVSSQLKITAEMYFALTPSCLMAGGKLSAVYNAGVIKAWFLAYADFLLSWQPFYYLIDMGITIGVEADLGLFSISVHLGVDLHIWGPEFAGQIDVDLSVVSFTVRFGPDKAPPAPLKAQEFVVAFLPPAKPAVVPRQMRAPRDSVKREVPKPAKPDVITTQINSGLLRQEAGQDKEPLRVVNGHALAMSVQSMIPVTSFSGVVPADGQASIKSLDLLGVRPMGKTKLESEFSVSIRNILDTNKPAERDNLRVTTIENGVPEALWGKSAREGVVPAAAPEAKTITVTLGIRFAFAPIHPKGALPAMDIEKFAFETFNKPIPWDPTLKPAPPLADGEVRGDSLSTVMSVNTTNSRNAVLDVLARQSPFTLNKVDLTELVKNRESYFQADPALARLGSLNESIV